jgi:hypothetical protein
MTSNNSPPDDSLWSSLAQELGLDSEPTPTSTPTPTPKSLPPQPTPIAVSSLDQISGHLVELPDAAEDDDTSLEPNLSNESIAENEGEGGEDEGGEGGKRRRRRRRRRRKGGPAGAEGVAEGTADGNPDETGEVTEDSEGYEEESHAEVRAPDALRDVVASWNVPSWDELIGGLYRPGS